MSSTRPWILSLSIALVSGCAVAQPNGCGTGWNKYLVPDRIPVLNCEFGDSCNKHDACYSVCLNRIDGECEYRRCRPGGDLEGSPLCLSDANLITLAEQARIRRNTCDLTFHSDLRNTNRGKVACEALAIVYRDAVKLWGHSAFSGFGLATLPEAWKQPQDQYNKAIADFFANASADDFRRFVESADRGDPSVNLCGRLSYSTASGLTNMGPVKRDACK